MSDLSFGHGGIPAPPRWLAIPLVVVLLAYGVFLAFVLAALVLPWQGIVVAALVAAAALFALWHFLFGRKGC